MTKYDSWLEWHDAEKTKLNKNVIDWVIHPSGIDKSNDEWESSGKNNAEYTIAEIDLNEDESVLEYGCGNGRILKHLKNYHSYGVDIVPDFVEEANDNDCDAYLLEDFKEKVDKVYSLTVFIHLRHEQAEVALKYIHEHLNEDGLAYLQVLTYGIDKDATNFSDMTMYDLKTFEEMALKCGFEIIKSYEMEGNVDKNKFSPDHNKYTVLKKL